MRAGEGAVYSEALEVGRQLVAGGEPCGPLITAKMFRVREAANPGNVAGDTGLAGDEAEDVRKGREAGVFPGSGGIGITQSPSPHVP